MQQYFVNMLNEHLDEIRITGDDAHHIIKVMRMKKNDMLLVVINQIKKYECQIMELSEKDGFVLVKPIHEVEKSSELSIEVGIILGLLKSDKFDYAVQKLTELGVSEIIPWQAEFSVVKVNEKNMQKKRNRWQTIAKEAAEQSKRLIVPQIAKPQKLADILALLDTDSVSFVAFEKLAGEAQAVLEFPQNNQKIYFIIGPEGGIAPKELQLLDKYQKQKDIRFISLGNRILRAETAAIFAMSLSAAKNEGLV